MRRLLPLLVAAALAAEEPPPLSDEEAFALRARIWEGLDGGAKAVAALVKELERRKLGVRQVEELVRLGRPPGGQREGRDVLDAPLPDGSKAEYGLYVPEGHDPAKALPLVVELHGSGDTGPHHLDPSGWREIADREGILVAAPTASHEKGQVGTRYGAELVWATIRDVSRRCRVDPDRVYLSGFSRGAHASWWLGIQATDRFAGIAPRAGSPKNLLTVAGGKERIWELFPNVKCLPIYILHGAQDPLVPVEGSREARGRLAALGGDFVYDERDPGGHNNFPERNGKVWEFWKGKRRDPVPTKVSWVMNDRMFSRAWWVSIDEMEATGGTLEYVVQDPGGKEIERRGLSIRTAEVEATIEDRSTVRVRCRNVRKVTLHLDDRLVDLDREVAVIVGGVAEKRRFARSLSTLLSTAAERGDPDMAFTVKATLHVP